MGSILTRSGYLDAYQPVTVRLPAIRCPDTLGLSLHRRAQGRPAGNKRCTVELRILGPVEVTRGGGDARGGRRADSRSAGPAAAERQPRGLRRPARPRAAGPGLGPDKAAANLQVGLKTQLRGALRSAGEADRLVTRPPGYVFAVAVTELDVLQFEQLAATGRAALARGDPAAAARLLGDAMALWHGQALADLGDPLFAVTERARLEDARLDAVESRMDALLACGRRQETVTVLEGADGGAPAARAVLGSASARALSLRPPGRRAARLSRGPHHPGQPARSRAGTRAAPARGPHPASRRTAGSSKGDSRAPRSATTSAAR